MHPDDVGLVADLLTRFNELQREAASGGPAFRPDPSDVRLRSASGEWLTVEAATYDHTQNPSVRGVLIICKLIVDRSDIGRAIELLGSGAPVDQVLPLIARLGDQLMGARSRCLIAWKDNDEVRVTWSPDASDPHRMMIEAARCSLGNEISEAVTIADFDHPSVHGTKDVAERAGYSVVNIFPIILPGSTDVIGSLMAWGHHRVDLSGHPQLPLQTGLRLAALAISEGRSKDILRWNASHDPLTSLINRSEFARRLSRLDGSDIALLYVDLDDFKPINDEHGHPVGDAVLTEVAHRIRSTIGDTGFVGRLGGDEFAIAVSGIPDVEAGWMVADHLAKVISTPMTIGSLNLTVGASIGVALGVQPLIPSILIRRADDALLAAKRAGKNRVQIAH